MSSSKNSVQKPKYPYKKPYMLNKRLFEKPWFPLLPVFVCYAYVLGLTLFFKGWTWSLYDELSWVHYHHYLSLKQFLQNDLFTNGRFRPLAPFLVFTKLSIFGLSPQLLRLVRVLEVLATAGMAAFFLKNHISKHRWFIISAGLLFWLKAAPQLDQARWMFTGELNGLFFLAAALFLRKYNKPLSYLSLFFMITAKEPFIILLPLPALLEKKWREFFITAFLGFLLLLAFALNRKGYGTNYGAIQYPGASAEILKQFLKDFFYLVPLLILFSKKRVHFFKKNKEVLWRSAILLLFAATYAVLVFPMLWGYTYMLAPSLFLVGLSLAFFLSSLEKAAPFSRSTLLLVLALISIFSLKISYNWTKNFAQNRQLHALFEGLSKLPQKGPVGSNCPVDNRNVGFGADILVKPVGQARANGPSCYKPEDKFASCCQGAQTIALGKECTSFDQRVTEANQLHLPLLYSNAGWKVFQCR